MSEFQTKLRNQLLRNPVLTLKEQRSWQLPVYTFEVAFSPVRRFRLDILMRMILQVIETVSVRRARAIADLLYVEELFIEDLLEKMTRNGLIELGKEGYALTSHGSRQLAAGVFEEEQAETYMQLVFSPLHTRFLPNEADVEFDEHTGDPFRYAKENAVEAGEQFLLTGVQEALADKEEHTGDFVETVNHLLDFDEGELQWVTCYEFLVHDTKENMTYVRVWNPLVDGWDATLEEVIEQQEGLTWKNAPTL